MKAREIVLLALLLGGCAAPLRTSVAPFRAPESFPNAKKVGELTIAVDALDTAEKSARVFGTDLAAADILPVHLIVSNKGAQEFEIDSAQIFGIAGGEYYPAFNLTQAAERVRGSSIGTTVAAQAAVGAIATAAAGAAVGAGIGHAAGDSGRGAAAGAAIGAGTGGLAGAAAGASDRYTNRFRYELAVQDFGARNIYPGDMHRGFIYFQRQPYSTIRIKVTNVSERRVEVIEIPVEVGARK
jgi:outer membrane lipoprotein SlyB